MKYLKIIEAIFSYGWLPLIGFLTHSLYADFRPDDVNSLSDNIAAISVSFGFTFVLYWIAGEIGNWIYRKIKYIIEWYL